MTGTGEFLSPQLGRWKLLKGTSKTTNMFTWNLFVYIFFGSTLRRPFQSKQGLFGFQVFFETHVICSSFRLWVIYWTTHIFINPNPLNRDQNWDPPSMVLLIAVIFSMHLFVFITTRALRQGTIFDGFGVITSPLMLLTRFMLDNVNIGLVTHLSIKLRNSRFEF